MWLGRGRILFLLGLSVLAGCDDKKDTPLQQEARMISRSVQFAQDQMRIETGRPGAQFRGVMPWTQALRDQVAVCGQVALNGEASDAYVPFVSVVGFTPGDAAAPLRMQSRVVGSTAETAAQVYQAMLDHCWEKGGPKTAPFRIAPPMQAAQPAPTPAAVPSATAPPRAPAAPATAPSTQQAAQPAAPPPSPPATPDPAASTTTERAPASGSVTMRQAGNLRSSPHGGTLRVVPRGTALTVFSQAAGGWYEVGDTAPWGWIHSSMLDKR